MILFRPERFGGVAFDTKTMGFSLVGPDECPHYDRLVPAGPENGRNDILSAPVAVYYEITRECNLECAHCFTGSGRGKKAGLGTAEVFALLDSFARAGVINVRFTGGEPTARSDWFEALSRARSLGFAVSLQTNGVFDEPDLTAGKLAGLGLDQITVSVDGVGDAHDALRGSGSFARVERSLAAMKDAGIRPRINTMLTRLNADRLGELFDFVSRYSDSINIFYMRPIGRGIRNSDIMIDFELHHATSENVAGISRSYPNLRVFHSASMAPGPLGVPRRAGVPDIIFPCGSSALSVAADGSFWPHHYSMYQSPALLLGRFPQDDVSSVWSGSEKLDRVREWLRRLHERCLRCPELGRRCSGVNFEMELDAAAGRVESNPFCVSDEKVPAPDFE